MTQMKKGDELCCADCGLAVVVNKACGCFDTELFCCGEPMTKVESPGNKAKKKAVEHSPPKGAAKRTAKAH